jgi:segregation and condensation protein B
LRISAASKPSPAALETLAIVAYRQPINRNQVEEIRGVNCERVLRALVAQSLIHEVGRSTSLGRPVLYGTTDEFLLRFGLGSLAELPTLDLMSDARSCGSPFEMVSQKRAGAREDASRTTGTRVPKTL